MIKKKTAPRIYNLFPRLVGTIDNWDSHLNHIQNMGFNWVFVNPVNYSGFSGSLYSIKDYFRLNPLFAINKKDEIRWGSLKTFITKCHVLGIKFMIDIVFNHTAVDSILMPEHNNWFKEKWVIIEKSTGKKIRFFKRYDKPPEGEYPKELYEIKWQIANPFAINPDNVNEVQIWGDLAEIDYNSPDLNSIISYWKKLFDFYDMLGMDGYRADAAYQVPAKIWKTLIPYVKNKTPNAIFYAETLGATLKQYDALSETGFDYFASSSKWWDFTAPWCVKQYNRYRKFAPSISFPENHDTHRVAAKSQGREDVQKFRYFFASFFSAGVIMPIGYEYGFKKRINVINSSPNDYEEPNFDISEFIQEVNKWKQKYHCLNEDGEIVHFEYPDLGILILRKRSINNDQQILLIYNKDWNNYHQINIPNIEKFLNYNTTIFQIKISGEVDILSEFQLNQKLHPNEFLLFIQESK